MQRLGELLIEAGKKPRDRDDMVISATGALSIAARALNDLAEPLPGDECDADLLREDYQARLDDAQTRAWRRTPWRQWQSTSVCCATP